MNFNIMDTVDGTYNAIIGQPALSQFEVVVSLIDLNMKLEEGTRMLSYLHRAEKSTSRGGLHITGAGGTKGSERVHPGGPGRKPHEGAATEGDSEYLVR
ncbi:hypothetical protein LIER_25813 [Lithospermum erythrorhizon]|uniref:Uncharacterized protein n=1 Tax=Lithospermum erythrorhizon TaxID=34254 RepID=A0AAV3R651_LITER